MKNLFRSEDAAGIISRLEGLTADAQRKWGKMNVNQMLAHCNASLATAMGLDFSPRVGFILRIIGKLVKPAYFGEKPFPRNSSTDKRYIISGSPDFDVEKARAIQRIREFSEGGAGKCTTYPQAFFGRLMPEEWAIMQWKHFDHHLRQFGV